jgi:hypothetical protein
VSGKRGRSSKQIWRSTTTSTTTYIHARSRSPGRVLRGRRDGDSSARRPKTPPMDPGALHAGPLAPPRHDTDARSHCSEARIAHAPFYTTPAGQYTANETGACLGWIVDWRNARPCLVGVAVGNLPPFLRAREGQRASNETGSTIQGCSAALGLGTQARCASMQAAACGPNRPTQIYKAADEGNARRELPRSRCARPSLGRSYEPARYSSSHHSYLASSTHDDPYICSTQHTHYLSLASLTHIHEKPQLPASEA